MLGVGVQFFGQEASRGGSIRSLADIWGQRGQQV